MGSALKAKLNRLKSAPESQPQPTIPALMEHIARFPVDQRIYDLSEDAMRRMGFEGAFHPEKALFLDTETTGLSGGAGTVAFLIGLGRIQQGALDVYQYLMPAYSAEPLLLEKLAECARGCDTVVTFNGKSFDVPLLISRHIMNRMDCPLKDMRHMDLIHPARRAWKLRLKDCSLGNLEEKALSIRREHDLPGSEVPERYFSFLKTGDVSLLTDVIDHNRLDVATLAALLVRLVDVYAAPAEQTSLLDVFSIGRALEKRGETNEACRCYRLAAQPRTLTDVVRLSDAKCAPMANRNLSLLLRRSGKISEAEQVWLEMIRRRHMDAFPYVELAKLREHRDRKYAEALALSEQAFALCEPEEREAVQKRISRLQRRLKQETSRED